MRIELVKPGDPANTASKLNEIITAINELAELRAGPGLVMRKTSAGTVISSLTAKNRQFVQNWDGGTAEDLAHTQGTQDTDDWKMTADTPVTVNVITDIQYSNVTHKIQFRTRTLTFDRGGNLREISAESDLVDITTAIACTAQL